LKKTIWEIQAEHSSKAGEIANSFLDQIDAIKSTRQPEDGAYLDRLADEQKHQLRREQAVQKKEAARSRALPAYREEAEHYVSEAEQRRAYITDRLFKVESADVAMRAATASEAELREMLGYAAMSGNGDVKRAVYTAAHNKGMGDVLSDLHRMDPEAAGLYQEYTEIPPSEVLQRQVETAETVLPDPSADELV
jgi:hypothetical protein